MDLSYYFSEEQLNEIHEESKEWRLKKIKELSEKIKSGIKLTDFEIITLKLWGEKYG